MNIITDPDRIDAVLSRGVVEVIGVERLRQRMLSGERLRIKLGIDPTSASIHLGRTIPLLKLRDFQQLGHQVVLIIGGFTAQIGDTSDKDAERPMLSAETVQENYRTYMDQVGKIIDLSVVEFRNNNDWLQPLSFGESCVMADDFSVNDFIARDVIARRLDAGKRVSLREMLYPLMQGYDSVHVQADVEIGGTDQRFNCLAGRILQKTAGQEPQSIVVGPIINGTDGVKMSSSRGNVISLTMSPVDMFGRCMTINDDLIMDYWMMLTRVPLDDIALHQRHLNQGVNPRDIKMRLAHAITAQYYGVDAADDAHDGFTAQFTNNELPAHMPDISPSAHDIITVLTESGLVESKTEARRMIQQGGVRVNQEQIHLTDYIVVPGDVVSRGKLHFVRIA